MQRLGRQGIKLVSLIYELQGRTSGIVNEKKEIVNIALSNTLYYI
jgi:hypothetical protein